MVFGGIGPQEACAAEHDRAFAVHHRLSPDEDAQGETASSPGQDRRLPASTTGVVDLCRGPCRDVDRIQRLMRVYIPVTLTMLQKLVTDGSLRPVNGTAFAVTPMLREGHGEGDQDELGEVATDDAAVAA